MDDITPDGNGRLPGKIRVTIVGGGLVGSIAACAVAQRGHQVQLYEYRDDPRTLEVVRGRSINLAMSVRARKALRLVGLEENLLRHGIPMRARMIHTTSGKLSELPYDARGKEVVWDQGYLTLTYVISEAQLATLYANKSIYSVSRRYLNEVLLDAAEKYPNVKIHFNHKLVSGKLDKGEVQFKTKSGKIVETKSDLVIGADGSYSATRALMMKQPLFNYSQTYIEHGYQELCIPPTNSGEFAMAPNFLHIWPRGTFMLIALPNQDRSWTVTLFMPFAKFEQLHADKSGRELLDFFKANFRDALDLIGKNRLLADFFSNEAQALVSIKCQFYNTGGSALIIGDAAHAMVPFYGQGMNCGFEDVSILDTVLFKIESGHDPSAVLTKYSRDRAPNAAAICDLAMYNYIEMRDLVNRPSFLLRKKLDAILFKIMPKTWIPLYNSVTFSEMPYRTCISNKEWQDMVLRRFILAAGVLVAGAVLSASATALSVYLHS